MTTPTDLLARELRSDGARPLITWYGATGAERVELSVATTANWVAKTAGYLLDELVIEPGDRVAISPSLHWLTAVVHLAAWGIGARVDPDGDPVHVPLDPMGAEFSRMVAAYPDSFVPPTPAGVELLAHARELPRALRLLTVLPLDDAGLGWGLLGPLAAGGSVVYASGDAPGLDDRARAERVTHTVGVDLAGLPRLG